MGTSNINKSPLDKVVKAIDDIRHGGRDAKRKVEDLKSAPRRKFEEVKARLTPDMCSKVDHSGKRGSNCQRCGNKLL